MFPDSSCLLLIIRQHGFLRNLGSDKQPHSESTWAWPGHELWPWSWLVCVRSRGSFRGREFASCKVWFKVVGTRLWTSPGDHRPGESRQGPPLSPMAKEENLHIWFLWHIQGWESWSCPRGHLRRKPNICVSCHVENLRNVSNDWERCAAWSWSSWWCQGVAYDISNLRDFSMSISFLYLV